MRDRVKHSEILTMMQFGAWPTSSGLTSYGIKFLV